MNKVEKKVIDAMLAFKKKNGRYPKNAELMRSLNSYRETISVYRKKLSKYLEPKKSYSDYITIKKEYEKFFMMTEKQQEKVIDNAMKAVDKSK